MKPSKTIKKGKFVTVWLMSFCAMFTISSVLGIIPEEEEERAGDPIITEALADSEDESGVSEEIEPELPLRVRADKVGLNTSVMNPESRDINVLDGELTKGAVRYPGSGLAGSDSNVFIFGHSSHLPVVNNQAYKAFNNIEKLEVGDEVTVETERFEFIYKVTSVKMVSAEEALVNLETGKAMITLSTCNNFGSRSDRFVVEAELAERIVK